MQTNSLHTAFGRSTIHPITNQASHYGEQALDVRHAALVVSRMIRSTDHRDQEVRERLERAATIMKSVRNAMETQDSSRPRDMIFQLAGRLIRCLRF